MLAAAREKPGTLNFGSTSPGGSPHMSAELLKMMAGVDIVHVPYKGAGPMLADLIGGQIQIGFDNLPSSMSHIKSGKIRAIAVTTTKRWPGAPEIPTIAESGVPGYEVSGWFGLLAPAGTPRPVVDALYAGGERDPEAAGGVEAAATSSARSRWATHPRRSAGRSRPRSTSGRRSSRRPGSRSSSRYAASSAANFG